MTRLNLRRPERRGPDWPPHACTSRGEASVRVRRVFRSWRVLLLASLLVPAPVAFPRVSAARGGEARATFDRATRMRVALEAEPETDRRKSDYEKLIRTYQAVYRLDTAYTKTPVALAAAAEIYEEMGRVYSTERYFVEALQAYRFLITEYPYNSLGPDALYEMGRIYLTDLKDPEEARAAFQKFLELYPRSPKRAEVREKLKEISRAQQERRAAASAPAKGLPEVTGVRRWVGPDYSRIVIGLDGEAKFDTSRLRDPDRIVLDLSNTRLGTGLASKTFPVEDGYLRQIRIAQFRPNVTRVVLDVEKIEDYSIFTLPNPFRLVIDIHGGPTPVAEKIMTPIDSGPSKPAPLATEGSSAQTQAQRPPAKQTQERSPQSGAQRNSEETAAGNSAGGEQQTKEVASLGSRPGPEPNHANTKTAAQPSREIRTPVKAAAPTESGEQTLTRALGLKIGRVGIDPGHGGHDTGTIGPKGLREKDVVLDVALRLKKLIEKNRGSSVLLTRRDDTFIPLEERTAIANEKAADLFISVHANASRDPDARGVETYYLNFTSSPESLEVAARENATSQESVHELQDLIKKIAMTEKIRESREFAQLVQHELYASVVKAGKAQRDRGLKKAPFVVLIGANMPSILAEISFLSNPRDERLLKRRDYRQKVAQSLYQGITRYVDNLGGTRMLERAQRRVSPPATSAKEPFQDNPPNF